MDARSISKALQALNYGSWKSVGAGGELLTPDNRTVEVGGCEHEKDKEKYQGAPHDLLCLDELPQFLESQYTFVIGWNRPANPRRYPHQRCRVVGAGNPPTNPEGEWVLRRWRAWLDPTAGNKAEAGELRWYTTIAGEEVECADHTPVPHAGALYVPRSRTFIPARLEDNPDLMRTGYAATLEAMPEPLRSMLRYGDMMAARQDDAWQLIKTRWVVDAQHRWVRRKEAGWGDLVCVGVDPARGGADKTALARRYEKKVGKHVSPTIGDLVVRKGKDTSDGQSVVNLFLPDAHVRVNVDSIGIGASAYDIAVLLKLSNVRSVVVSNATHWRDPKMPQYKFANTRSAMMWNVAHLLDPEAGPDETRLALPPDPQLLADLTAARYELRVGGVAVEKKEDIRERIGRSPDVGDAVALACWRGGVQYSGLGGL